MGRSEPATTGEREELGLLPGMDKTIGWEARTRRRKTLRGSLRTLLIAVLMVAMATYLGSLRRRGVDLSLTRLAGRTIDFPVVLLALGSLLAAIGLVGLARGLRPYLPVADEEVRRGTFTRLRGALELVAWNSSEGGVWSAHVEFAGRRIDVRSADPSMYPPMLKLTDATCDLSPKRRFIYEIRSTGGARVWRHPHYPGG